MGQQPQPGMGIFAMMASTGAVPGGLATGTPFPPASGSALFYIDISLVMKVWPPAFQYYN